MLWKRRLEVDYSISHYDHLQLPARLLAKHPLGQLQVPSFLIQTHIEAKCL